MSAQLRKLFIMSNLAACKIWEFLEQDKSFFFDFQVEPVLNKLEKLKPRGPLVSVSQTDGAQTALIAFRQRSQPPCPRPRPHRHCFPTHCFPAATSPSFTASGGYKGCPPPPWSTLSSSSAFYPPLHHHSCRS
jgi:hypothetical protein